MVDKRVSSSDDSVQYEENLPRRLKPGRVIVISGTVLNNCSRFTINFICKKSAKRKTKDIAFHFSPLLDKKIIVRNCCIGGKWRGEETISIEKFPFHRNQKFNLHMFVAKEVFLVSQKGKHICGFALSVPLPEITTIEVSGLVDVDQVEYRRIRAYPEPGPENEPAKIGTSKEVTSKELEIPYTGILPMVLKDGSDVEIFGKLNILPLTLCIRIQKGAGHWPHPRIALHCLLTFGETPLLSMNSCINGKWGKEERKSTSRFPLGSDLNLGITRFKKMWKIWKSDVLIGEYKFSESIKESNIIYIQGDFTLKHIYLKI